MSQILNNIYHNTAFALNLNSKALIKLQEQASTGSRINRPSDDPSDAFRVLGLSSQKRNIQNSIDNISNCVSVMEISSTIVNQMSKTLADTKTVLAGVTDTDGQIGEAVYANSIDNHLEELVSLANKKHNGQYLFGGSNTGSKPYEVVRKDGKIVEVNYTGSLQEREVKINDSVNVTAFYSGNNLFGFNESGETEFIGSTGVKEGDGTSTAKGFTWLEVEESAPGTYRLSTDGFDSYAEVNVPPGDTNTKVTNSETGEVLYIDTTGVTDEGTELVLNGGTHDIFDTLITLRDVYEGEKDLGSDQLKEINGKGIDVVEQVSELLSKDSVLFGSRIGYLEDLKTNLEDIKLNTEEERTRIQEADIAQIATDLSRREMLYQMSIQTASKMMSLSLFDFIR